MYAPHSEEKIRRIRWVVEGFRRYHRHRVIGLERLVDGPSLIVFPHSLATYDIVLFGASLVDLGHRPYALGDDKLFALPVIRRWVEALGGVRACPENGERLLRDGHMVFVAPGGMREALRPSEERYRTRWEDRKGFVRLALKMQVPVHLVVCPAADRLYTVYPAAITKIAYKKLKVPIPLVRGLGPSLVPRPVRLTHLVSEPMWPKPVDSEHFERQVEAWHRELSGEVRGLVAEALRL